MVFGVIWQFIYAALILGDRGYALLFLIAGRTHYEGMRGVPVVPFIAVIFVMSISNLLYMY